MPAQLTVWLIIDRKKKNTGGSVVSPANGQPAACVVSCGRGTQAAGFFCTGSVRQIEYGHHIIDVTGDFTVEWFVPDLLVTVPQLAWHIQFVAQGFIISSFYIKPQLYDDDRQVHGSCLISSFYIKPQLSACHDVLNRSCLISSFYIKPQQFFRTA